MYAIIESGGKQLRVEVGQQIYVERLSAKDGEEVVLDRVLLIGGEEVKVGSPYLKAAKVTAKVVKNGLGKKIRVFKYKSKDNYRRTYGHRQPYTCLVIEKIEA